MKKMQSLVKLGMMAVACVLFLGVNMKLESKAAVIGTPSGLKQTNAGTGDVEISWDAVIGNNIQYKVELCANKRFTGGIMDNLVYNDKEQVVSGTRKPKQAFDNLTPGRKYYVRVTAFTNTGEPYYQCDWGSASQVLEVVTAPADNQIQNLKQTGATETSLSLSWKGYEGANAYQLIYMKKGSTTKKTVSLGNVTSCTLKKLSKNAKYEIWIWPVMESASGYRALTGDGRDFYWYSVVPTKVKGVEAEFSDPTSNYLYLRWKQSESAEGYQYQIYTDTGKKPLLSGKKPTNGEGISFSSDKLKGSRFLKVRVRGYVEANGKIKPGAWSDWTYFSRQPQIRLKNTKSGVKLTWNKISGAHKYTVYVSDNRYSGYKKSVTTAKTTATVKKYDKSSLKSGRQYYFMAVANKKVGDKNFKGAGNYCYWITYKK